MSSVPIAVHPAETQWTLPAKGRVGIVCLIVAESAIFSIFVVAYLYYLGKNLNGPYPKDILNVPIFISICLLSSSATIGFAVKALDGGNASAFRLWWAATIGLALIFLVGTALEWRELIEKGLTIRTNLFGTSYYSLVGLHATHVVAGLILMLTVFALALAGKVTGNHAERTHVLAMYWHFVDGVWVVVFTVVYVIGR
jgi:cytochrome c oxidase subunit III